MAQANELGARRALCVGVIFCVVALTGCSGSAESPIQPSGGGGGGGGASKLAFTVQPTNAVAGATTAPAVQVAVQDAQGNAMTTATNSITVAIGTNPANGTLSGTTTVNAIGGVATFSSLSVSSVGTGYTLTAAATGLTGATSNTFTVGAGPASKLVFIVQPSNTAAGAAITPVVQVAVQDAQGNTVTTATNSITVAVGTNPATGTLSGTTTVAAVNGVATFATVSIDKPGVGYTLTASGTGLTGSTSSNFNVAGAAVGDYTLSLTPSTLTVAQGATGAAAITITRSSFTDGVTLTLGNAPVGVTGSFNPAVATGTGSSLTVSVGATVAPGVYNLTVAGTASSGSRSTPLTLTVNAAPTYALSLTPAALTIGQGATGGTTVTIARTNLSDAVTLSMSNAPPGVTASFDPASATGTSSALTVSVGTTVPAGVYNLTVNGSSTAGARSTALTLTVSTAPDYGLSLSPPALTLVTGSSGTSTATITRTNFTGAVTLSLGNAPAGVTGSFAPAAPTGTSSTLTVNVAGSVVPGVYNLTVDGTATVGAHSTPLTLTVSASISQSLVNGRTYSGTISVPGNLDTWTFTATQGDYIALSVGTATQTTAHFAPSIRLVSPTGVQLGNSFTGTGASNIGVAAPVSGTYTVIVGSYLGGTTDGTGSYLLTLAKGPGAVEVSTGDEGGPMANGATNAGTIYQGDFDTWTFTATQGDYIALSVGTLAQTTAHFAPWIRLVSPTGVLLGDSFTGTGASNIGVTAPTTGTYTVIVGSYLGGTYDGTGSYLLTLAKGPGAVVVTTGDEGGPMANGATNAGTIYQGDFDTWTFTATQGDYIALSVGTLAQTTAHFAPWIRLVSPTGVLLGNSFTGTGASNIGVTAPATGTYTVIIGSYLGGTYDGAGSYLLTLAKGPGAVEVSTGDEGGPMANGATNAGTIYQGDFDTWTFTATQGDYIALSVGTVAQTTAHFAPWIRLVSPTGVLLGNSFTGTGASNIGVAAPVSGTYTVIVGSYLGGTYDGTGSYLLTLAKGPGAVEVSTGDEGGPMANGATNAGTIYQGDFDTWTFTATQGDYIALSVGTATQTTAHFAPWIRLVSPTGVLLGDSFTGTGASNIGVTAPTTGTYTVIVGSYLGGTYDGTGSYLLTLAKGPGVVVVTTGDQGGPMANGANAGTIYQGDFDAWTFTAAQGDHIALSVVTVTQTTAHFAPWIRLVSPTGVLLGNSFTGTGASSIAVTAAPTTGTYTVIIGSYLGGTSDGIGSYSLTRSP